MKKFILCLIILALSFLFFFQKRAFVHGPAIFSWHDDVLDEKKEVLFSLMKDYGLKEVYQYFSSGLENEEILSFIEECKNNQIRVFALLGEANWALQEDGVSLIRAMERFDELEINGFVIDIEPHLLKDFKEDDQRIMDCFASCLEKGRTYVKEKNKEFIVCLPYHFDRYEQLEKIIDKGLDTLAIMNYYRRDEIAHLEKEASLCKKYNKTLITIYEFQKAGTYGLEEINTYHMEGFESLRRSYELMRLHYNKNSFNFSIHEFESFKEAEAYE